MFFISELKDIATCRRKLVDVYPLSVTYFHIRIGHNDGHALTTGVCEKVIASNPTKESRQSPESTSETPCLRRKKYMKLFTMTIDTVKLRKSFNFWIGELLEILKKCISTQWFIVYKTDDIHNL